MDPRKRKPLKNQSIQGRWLIDVGNLKDLGLQSLSNNYIKTTRIEGLKGAFLGLSKNGYFLKNDDQGDSKDAKGNNH